MGKNARRLTAGRRAAVLTAALALLVGCLKTDKSVDFTGSTVTPLPPVFVFAPLDANGQLPIYANTKEAPKLNRAVLQGDTYVESGRNQSTQLIALDEAHGSYMMRMTVDGVCCGYGILRIHGQQLAFLTPVQNVEPLLKQAGVEFTEKNGDEYIASKEQLLKAFRYLDAKLPDTSGITMRWAPVDQEASLQQALDAAYRQRLGEQPVSPAPLPAPPPAPPPPARDEAGFLQFDEGGYRNTVLLDEFYLDATEGLAMAKVSQYTQAFIEQLKQTEGCAYTISDPAYLVLEARAVRGQLTAMFNDELRNRERPMLKDPMYDVIRPSIQAVAPAIDGNMDARRFFPRHGCASAEARQILQNMEAWAIDPH